MALSGGKFLRECAIRCSVTESTEVVGSWRTRIGWGLMESAGEEKALALTSGEFLSLLAYLGEVAVGQMRQHVVERR